MNKLQEIKEKEHSRLSPSTSKIWLNCTKAPDLIAKYPEIELTDDYASEGTQAHWLGELLLKNKMTEDELPSEYKDVMIYVNKVREIQGKGTLLVEVNTDMTEALASPEPITGTSDAVILAEDNGIDIVDLKWGMGVWVSAVENSQELLYAVGAIDFLNRIGLIDIETLPTNTRITLHVVQPRVESMEYTFHNITFGELIEFVGMARQAVKEIFRGTGSFLMGEHCQFCKGKVFCPLYTSKAEEAEQMVITHGTELPAIQGELSPERLIQLYQRKSEVNAFYKALDKWLASAIKSSPDGVFMGYKIIEKEGDREVKDEKALIKQLTDAGIDVKEIKQENIVGFKILDQLAKRAGIKKEDLAGVGKKIQTKIVSAEDYRDLLFAGGSSNGDDNS